MFYLKVGSVANKKMIKKVYVAVQNFAAAPPKEGWSRTQISNVLLHEKNANFPLIKPQMTRKLAICWVLKLISHFFLSYFNIANQKY